MVWLSLQSNVASSLLGDIVFGTKPWLGLQKFHRKLKLLCYWKVGTPCPKNFTSVIQITWGLCLPFSFYSCKHVASQCSVSYRGVYNIFNDHNKYNLELKRDFPRIYFVMIGLKLKWVHGTWMLAYNRESRVPLKWSHLALFTVVLLLHDDVIQWKNFRVTGPLCFDMRLNKRLSKQSWGCWFPTPSRSFWRHRYVCDVFRRPDKCSNIS